MLQQTAATHHTPARKRNVLRWNFFQKAVKGDMTQAMAQTLYQGASHRLGC